MKPLIESSGHGVILRAVVIKCDVCHQPIERDAPHRHGVFRTVIAAFVQRQRERQSRDSADRFSRMAAVIGPKEDA